MEPALTISKLDAARRQLETAIRLYFQHSDPVSIHTLTAAAYNIIRDINNERGGDPMLAKQQIFERIKPEFRRMLRNKINEAENFFKHADKDHSNTLSFNPRQTEILLVDACSQYFKLTGEYLPLCILYRTWFVANNPTLFLLPEEQMGPLRMATPTIIEMGRVAYFNAMLSKVMSANG